MEDIKNSIKAILYERTTSPFWGTFTCSWIIFNWKIPYFIFTCDSDLDITQRIKYIQYLFAEVHIIGFIVPLIFTFTYIVVFQGITNWFYEVDLRYKTKKHNKKVEIEGKAVLEEEVAIQLKQKHHEIEANFNAINEKLKEDIKILNSTNSDLSKNLKIKTDELNQSNANNSKLQIANKNQITKIKELENEKELYLNNLDNTFITIFHNIFINIKANQLIDKFLKLENDDKINEFINYYNSCIGLLATANIINTELFNMELFKVNEEEKIEPTLLGRGLYFLSQIYILTKMEKGNIRNIGNITKFINS